MRTKFNYDDLCDILYAVGTACDFWDVPPLLASRETTANNERYSLFLCMYTPDNEMTIEIEDSRGNRWEGLPKDFKDSPLKRDFDWDALWEIVNMDTVLLCLENCEDEVCLDALGFIKGAEVHA